MGSPWTVVNHPSVKCRHPAEVVCEVDPLCFIQLVNTIEGSNHEQRQSIRWVRDSIKHCLRVHFYEQRGINQNLEEGLSHVQGQLHE